MKLYTAGLSPNGLDVELEEVDLRDPAAKVATLLPYNPNTKVPVLVDGEFVLWESRAIYAYLAGGTPLYPAEPRRRAVVDQWSDWHAVHLGPAMQRVNFEGYLKPRLGIGQSDAAALEAVHKEAAPFLRVLEGNLGGRDWVAGELSIADFSLASTFMIATPPATP